MKREIIYLYPVCLKYYILFCLLTLASFAEAQKLTGTIRGKVIDADNHQPVAGANVVVSGTDPVLGCVTGENGDFVVFKVPLGRQVIQVSYIGYTDFISGPMELTTGKETYVQVALSEASLISGEATVTSRRKNEAVNDMTTLSVRPFTVEETSRYAGNWGDPSRMASRFAGVSIISDKRNDIVVRGNSSVGVLWRLDGVDIPNPNHFAVAGSSGGAIGMINNNLLSNSDFITSAFPAEYGNATAAVFDLKLREGNPGKREWLFQAGVQGFEGGAEGPFVLGKRSTYLLNYRYSTLVVLDKLGISIVDAIPAFQDLSFRFNFPAGRSTFTLFGLGGMSSARFRAVQDSTDWLVNDSRYESRSGSRMGMVAGSWQKPVGEKIWLKTTLSSSAGNPFSTDDSMGTDYNLHPLARASFLEGRNSLTFSMNYKPSGSIRLKMGASLHRLFLEQKVSVFDLPGMPGENIFSDFKGNTGMAQFYVQTALKTGPRMTVTGGVHLLHFFMNSTTAADPRIAMRFAIDERNTITAGGGVHNQIQPLAVYFTEDGNGTLINKDLPMLRSIHSVVGYEHLFSEYLRIKAELYSQWIDRAAVSSNHPAWGLINFGGGDEIQTGERLTGNGKGINQGIELTIERFLHKNMYFLITASMFNSQYTGYDNAWRSTRFDAGYASNILIGKEFSLGKNNRQVLGLNLTWIIVGGQYYTPVDEVASVSQNQTVRIDSLTNSKQYSPFKRFDVRLRYRINHKKFSQEIAVELGNVFNWKNVEFEYYDKFRKEVVYSWQLPRVPLVFYRVEF